MTDVKDAAQAELVKSSVKVGQWYAHFKDPSVPDYEIVAVGLMEETLEPVVVYRNVLKGTTWVRTLQNFTESVTRDGKIQPRFILTT